ncbi:MAG TPA: porin family protein [Cyclobacteriaceae bacterium]|nr:porin family protein [Cyclobacteriaceae bacterium]
MFKRLLLALVLITASLSLTQAQQIHIGATTTVTANMLLDEGLNGDPRYDNQYTINVAPIGFNFGVDIGKKFGLQLETILANQNQIVEIVDAAKKSIGERKLDMSYLQLPLMMKFMGGGDGGARANFNFGPQLSVLLDAVESVQHDGGTLVIPDDPNWELPEGATDNGDGTYTTPAVPSTDVYTKAAGDFANTQFSIAAAFGLDIDLSKHLFLATQVRMNYSITDMRNKDVFDKVANGSVQDVISSSANVAVGIQLGLHYVFGSTRKFKNK